MTTMNFNQTSAYFTSPGAPRTAFAARLAGLQARHEQAASRVDVAGMVARGALALVPFLSLAWMFVAL